MPYSICINKYSPCAVAPFTATGSAAGCARSIEVYGCTPDLTAGENGSCTQGTYIPAGKCCAFTVPAGVTRVQIELWGAGGGGGSGSTAECCGTNPGGGAGTYVSGTLTVAPGDVLTLCAGAGGCFGPHTESSGSYCCCGVRGNCSFVLRNGTMCLDSQGGDYGISDCYVTCGCTRPVCGSLNTTGHCGTNSGCIGYSTNVALRAGPSHAYTPGCQWNQAAMGLSSGAAMGGEQRWWGYNCNCWTYLRWNTSCTNSAGVAGPGGDPGPTGTAYNTPGSTQYSCSTSDQSSCARFHSSPPGYFPGGGGASGYTTACCNSKTSGGGGASGYIRVLY